jgi:hypothetical protein
MRLLQAFCRAAGALLAVAVFSTGLSPSVSAQSAPASTVVWPLTVTATAGGSVVLYEPQVRTWPNFTQLAGIAAVAVTLPGASAPVYGTLSFTSLASADVPTGMLSLENSEIDAFSWPTAAPADATALTAFVKTNLHVTGKPMLPLALALASIPKHDRPRTTPLRANAPVIYVSKTPAVLVAFDGKPVFEPLTGTALQYAVNANSEVVHDATANQYYVRIKSGWFSAAAVTGPFAPATAPASFAAIPASGPWIHPLAAPSATAAPRFIVSMVPSALIDIAGDPQFADIPGTQLRYVSNTASDVFFSRSTTVWYVLLAGRWFSAANLNGPWLFTSSHLPKDFTKIPATSPRARVLVSVPGTTQAFYAASVAQVPHVTAVDAATAKLTVTYEGGTPSFEAIAGTSLQYAANADADVIEVSPTQYVACSDGVWYAAAAPAGPWAPATYVPAVVYTIPASSPLYRVTFVHVYNARGVAQTAPRVVPTPQPAATYQNFAASQFSSGDAASYYNANTSGYFGGFAPGWGGYAYGTRFYDPSWYGGWGYAFNPPHYGNWNDTTYARSKNPPPHFNMTVPAHGQRVNPGPNTNIYAAADGVYRYLAGNWQKNAGGETWTAVSTAPATLKKDRHARLDGYRGTTAPPSYAGG